MGRTRFIAAYQTEAGRAAKNQDAWVIFDVGLPDGRGGPRRTVKVAIVADGINGHQGGDVASKMAVDIIKAALQKFDVPILEAMQLAIQRANRSIFEESLNRPELRGMGCTVVMAVFDVSRLYVAHVGDSRVYLIRDGKIHQLTEDHTRESNASSSPQLTRRLGRLSKINVDLAYIPLDKVGSQSETQVGPLPLRRSDSILLCTDGLTAVLGDDYIQEIVADAGSPKSAANRLITTAKRAGASDDMTAVVVRWPNRWLRYFFTFLLVVFIALAFNPGVQDSVINTVSTGIAYLSPPPLTEAIPPTTLATATIPASMTATVAATPSQTPTSVASATPASEDATQEATAIAFSPSTMTRTPTFTPISTPTRLPTRLDIFTATPSPTFTVIPPTPTPPTPTEEQTPVVIPTPQPIATDTAQATVPPVAVDSSQVSTTTVAVEPCPSGEGILPPIIVAPTTGLSIVNGDRVEFRWRWRGELPACWGFEVKAFRQGKWEGLNNANNTDRTRDTNTGVYIDTVIITEQTGEMLWAIALVRRETAEHVYDELIRSESHTLRITGSSEERVTPSDTECNLCTPNE